MSEESNQGGNENPVMGLATRDLLEQSLDKDSMSLRHAAFIAHGASPMAGDRGMSADRRAAVKDTDDALIRSVKLKPLKTVGDQELYKTSEVFQELASRGHAFPGIVKDILLDKKLIGLGTQVRPQRHGNAERHENNRTLVLHAMVQVLADNTLHPTCRKGGAIDGPVIGADLARTIVSNRERLFDHGKLPLQSETIAKLFNEIVPPQVR